MATVTRRCESEKCRRRFRIEAKSRRRYCEECRPPRVRAGTILDAAPPVADVPPGRLEAAMRAQLEAADRHETPQGLLVLDCARDIDHGRVKPEAKATAGHKLLQLLEVALEGTRPATRDALDELAARRAAKASA